MVETGNLFQNVPVGASSEVFEALISRLGLRVERIVSHGQASPQGFWCQQVEAEWVVVLQGRACLRFEEGEVYDMFPGSYVLIQTGIRHRVDWTDPAVPTIWLAIHLSA